MPPAPSIAEKTAPQPYPLLRAGSLEYTSGTLRTVFLWLLAGEVVFTLIDMIEPRVLPVLLKMHGASDKEIAIIVGSFNAILQLLIMPPVGYCSDRLRTGWGRRVPFLFWATPVATVFLILTPFAPEMAEWAKSHAWATNFLDAMPMAPVIFLFGLLVLLYRTAQTVMNVSFFGLLRDVVPETHMGRFLSLFRLFGAGGTFIITYWLLGHVDTHSKLIFGGVAALGLVGFSLICWFVREGTYPPVETDRLASQGPWTKRAADAVRIFCTESFRHPVYLWVYFIRICLYGALLGLSGFMIFFPQYELGMDLGTIGQMLSWPCLIWLVIAYPIGRVMDTRGASYVLRLGLIVITLGYVLSFILVVGPKTFLLSSLVTGVSYWVVMLAQLKLTQEVFHPQRYSQLAGANTIVQSIAIAVLISPGAGWLLDALKGFQHSVQIPMLGEVILGPYRLLNLMMGLVYGLAWFGLCRLQGHLRRHGAPSNYIAPL